MAWRTVRTSSSRSNGLGEVLDAPGVAGPNRGIERVLRRENNDRHERSRGPHPAQRFHTVAVGQHHIGQHQAERVLVQQPIALGDRGAAGARAFGLKRGGDDQCDGSVIRTSRTRFFMALSLPQPAGECGNGSNPLRHPGRASRARSFRAPASGQERAPSPCPFFLPVTNGSKM